MEQKKQLLITEDNALNRAILSEILSDDYRILEAGNGLEALELLQEYREDVDLILLDIMMPVMDGYTFLDLIRKDVELAMIPVIVMTQGDSEADEISALEHGANDFVPKPYRPQIIKHRVASLIKFRETAAMVNQFQYDRLTGLYTKEFFYRKARERLTEDPEKDYTIVCTNLENFKLYNDTFGRKAGDRLLEEIAKLLPLTVGKDAICCRYSADRFLCLIEKSQERKKRARFIKDKEKNNFQLADNLVVKIGIYEITDRTVSVEQMCDRALLAVDSIKGKFQQNIAVYDDILRENLLREKDITDAMVIALRQKQFTIYLQPKYSLQDGSMVGAEALVRWIHPEWGFMSPGEFIPLFEKNGFISILDVYVWERTCEKLREWKEKGHSLVPISVNVSRADIYQSYLVDTFCDLVKKYDIDPKYLHLEITESAYTENPDQIISMVEKLRKQGFIIEMDDFGSGYSSLNMLGQMSLDVLKLDMKFIQNEMAKPVNKSLLVDVINMAHRMHLNVVAEGVETREQKKRLREMGCDIAQGYFFAKPMPENEFESLLKLQKRNQELSLIKKESAAQSLLVIEEDPVYLERVRNYFNDNYRILVAKNSKEALDYILEEGYETISAILLSITLPNQEASKFLTKLRQEPSSWRLPVLSTFSCIKFQEENSILLETDTLICKSMPMAEVNRRIERLTTIAAFQKRENDLQDEANQDYLSGLLNRRGFNDAMDSLRKDELPLAVCMFDLDNLKEINDLYGHDTGDQLIKTFAELIDSHTRKSDIRCRYGGDEFVIILKNLKNVDFAIKKCEDICKVIQEEVKIGDLKISCSCGISWCMANEVPSKNLIDRADQALYRAKKDNKGGCIYKE